jgi:hypothetical protein
VRKLCVASGHGRKTAKVRGSQRSEGRVQVGMVCVRECECVFVYARWCSECVHARVRVVVCVR